MLTCAGITLDTRKGHDELEVPDEEVRYYDWWT